MRKILLVLALLVLPSPSWAQPADVANALRATRSAYPTPMSKAQLSDFLNRVVAQFPGWGLLRKDSGNNCPTPATNVSISCDWIVNASSRWGYDVLSDSEGAATVVIGGGDALAAGAEVVFPWTVSNPQPQPTPQPVPPPVGGLVTPDVIRAIVSSEVDKVYAQNERIFSALQNLDDLNTNAILGRLDKIQEDVNNPGWFKKVVGNRYFQIIAAGAAMYFGRSMFGNQQTPQTP